MHKQFQYNSLQCQLTYKVLGILITLAIECHQESCLWNYIFQKMAGTTACFCLQEWQKHRFEKMHAIYGFA